MKKQPRNTQKLLVNLKNLKDPDYTTFQKLLTTHGTNIGQPFFAHFKTPAMRLLVFIYSRRLRELTESEYESVRDDRSEFVNAVKDYLSSKGPEFLYILNNYVNNSSMTVNEIAISIGKSKTTVRRYIDELRGELVQEVSDKVFHRDLAENGSVKAFHDKRYDEFTKPFKNTARNRLLIDSLNTKCELNWNLPNVDNSLDWDKYCELAGKLFGLVSLKTACGARILYEGGKHSEVKDARIRLFLDKPYEGCKNYSYSKKCFVKYIKLHKDKVSSIM